MELFTSISQDFIPLEWNRITRVGWSWLFPFSRSVRQVTQFPLSAGLVKNRVHPLLEDRGFFSKIFFFCENLVKLLKINPTIL